GLTPEMAPGAGDRVLLRDAAGAVRAGYRGLVAVDAEGRELAASMAARDAGVALVIDDARAVYPVEVDPILWTQTQELALSPASAAVALGGGTAVAGSSPTLNATNVDFYTQSGVTWSLAQSAVFSCKPGCFGAKSVSISGPIAVVGTVNQTQASLVGIY